MFGYTNHYSLLCNWLVKVSFAIIHNIFPGKHYRQIIGNQWTNKYIVFGSSLIHEEHMLLIYLDLQIFIQYLFNQRYLSVHPKRKGIGRVNSWDLQIILLTWYWENPLVKNPGICLKVKMIRTRTTSWVSNCYFINVSVLQAVVFLVLPMSCPVEVTHTPFYSENFRHLDDRMMLSF